MSTASTTVERFRPHPGRAVAGLIVALSLASLGVLSAWLLLLMLLPVTWSVWAWRAGTDAGPDGLRVRALLGERRIPWSRVKGLVTDERGRVTAVLDSGGRLPLTGVTATDLPRLTAASNGMVPPGQPGHPSGSER